MRNHDRNDPEAGFARALDLAGGLLVAGLAIGGVLFVPTWFDASRAEVDAEIARLEALADDEARLLAEHATVARDRAAAEARLARAIERVPLRLDESAFLDEVVALADRHAIQLGDYETGRVVSRPTHDELDVVINGRSDHGALCRLLAGLGGSPRAGRVTELVVDRVEDESAVLSFRLSWRLYSRPVEVASKTEG
jgi:hypothetical protein